VKFAFLDKQQSPINPCFVVNFVCFKPFLRSEETAPLRHSLPSRESGKPFFDLKGKRQERVALRQIARII
jgi:hypothetical protein